MTDRFDDIRPFHDSEVNAAMWRISDSVFFPEIAEYVFPDEPLEKVRRLMRSLQTCDEFQREVMNAAVCRTIQNSISHFSYSGLEYLSPGTRYLFVSNHRDIVLDSSLVQHVLFANGFPTTEITFGSNLMCMQLLVDIGRSNKMFRVERGGDSRSFYRSSAHLSDYIRHTILEKQRSVWIAQRNGRTKDGCDVTDQGLVKMFSLSGAGRRFDGLDELNIAPVSISYEWEPCDILKARELYDSRGCRYEKKPGEDFKSILTGILQQKGKVHLAFTRPLSKEEFGEAGVSGGCELNRYVARLIDRRINDAYRLTSYNYLAADRLSGKSNYAGCYSQKDEALFDERISRLSQEHPVADPAALVEIFLGIYGNWRLNKQG